MTGHRGQPDIAPITRMLLSAAVAGVLAGTGSAIGAAVAHAEPSASDSSSSDSSNQTSSNQAGASERSAGSPQRGLRGQVAPPSAGPVSATPDIAAAVDVADIPADIPTAAPRSRTRAQAPVVADSVPVAAVADSQPQVAVSETTAPAPATPPVEAAAPEPVVTVNDVPAIAETPAANPSPAAAPTPPAAVTPVAEPVVVIATVSPVVAAAPVLTPAPAASEPVPVRLPAAPLLPVLPVVPAVPVAPASAVTVGASSSANSRVRAASAVAQAVVIGDPTATHVLLIGTDGTNLDKILQYTWDNPDATGFQTLMDEGITSATSIVGHTTISGPSWTTILTGVWDTKSGVINNLFDPAPYNKWPTVFNMLENYNPNIDTAVVADWQYINDIAAAGSNPVDGNHFVAFDTSWAQTDQLVTDKTIELISNSDPSTPTFIFSYQVQVDEAGHGYGGASPEYRQAVINVGDNIAEIMAAVHAAELETGVDWTVIVTTDHGHQQSKGFGHGFQSPNETSSFIIFDEAGDPSGGKQNQSYSNADITPTIVNLFGAPMRSDFDGVSLTTKTSGIVTPVDLKTSLNDAIDGYGYPNIGVDIALGTRTVFATVPYLIDGFITNVVNQLQAIVDKDIFLISGLADITKWIVQFNGNLMVGVTEAVARVVAHLTGAGTIPPSDPPLSSVGSAESTDSDYGLLLSGAAVLT